MPLKPHEVDKLLDKALKNQLTLDEEAQLQEYMRRKDGQRHFLGHRALRNHAQMQVGQQTWRQHELNQIAAEINTRIEKGRRRRRFIQPMIGFSVATAALVGLIFLFQLVLPSQLRRSVFVSNSSSGFVSFAQPAERPAARPLDMYSHPPRPIPSFEVGDYLLGVGEAHAEFNQPALIPAHIPEDFIFVGSDINLQNEALEIAFVETPFFSDERVVWILSQRPVDEDHQLTVPLKTIYRSIPFLDVSLFFESMQIEIEERPAFYTVRKKQLVQEPPEWHYEIAVVWLSEGHELTLTAHTAHEIAAATMVGLIDELQLRQVPPPSSE